MRKIIEICLLCVGLLLTASGCTQPNERNEPEETVSTLSPVENEVSVIQEEGMMLPETINYEYEIQELCTERDGRRIYGVIYIPKTAQEKMPTFIFSQE